MSDSNNELEPCRLTPAGDDEAIEYLKQAIASGKHWYIALLEAIGLWTKPEESRNGHIYRYLIAGEAFDWLLLAERLCETIDGLLPDDEKTALLFYGKPPLDLTTKKFKEMVGTTKYRQSLSHFYGITVEEALILAVRAEVRKEQQNLGYSKEQSIVDEAYRRIYGAAEAMLLRQFRREKGYPQLSFINLAELKEFVYWLFKYRLEHCEKARVASDTKKALKWLSLQSQESPGIDIIT